MSIELSLSNELKSDQKKTDFDSDSYFILPKINELYSARIQRLNYFIKQNHTFSDYFHFVKMIVLAQKKLLNFENYFQLRNLEAKTLLSAENLIDFSHWHTDFFLFLDDIEKNNENNQIKNIINSLKNCNKNELNQMANFLLNKHFEQIESEKAVFIWAALSEFWAKSVSKLNLHSQKKMGKQYSCPICDSLPIVSVIHHDKNGNKRFLHCSLCESEWYFPRTTCTNCGNQENIQQFMLDNKKNAIKAESCESCGSYLKLFDRQFDPNLEIIADNLSSIFLDIHVEEKDFFFSGLNPFIFYNPS